MLLHLRTSILVLIWMTVLTGVIYPLVVTGMAQVLFPQLANGSLIIRGEQKAIGSELIGQPFSQPGYFWGRLSATSTFPYNAASSSGSNLGPLNPLLKEASATRIAALGMPRDSQAKIPVDLVTASASGLDPHISPAAAEFQVPRVAMARKVAEDAVRELVNQNTEGRQFGILGEARVNVLRLNLALDQHFAD